MSNISRSRPTPAFKATRPRSGQSTTPRNAPQQLRSRQRHQDLLDAAEAIIAEVGLDGLSMREVGRRAHLPIASIYHYYPSASALVRALAERQLDLVGKLVQEAIPLDFDLAANSEQLVALIMTIIDKLYAHLTAIPAAPAIWNALRSNPELRALDRADTERVAWTISPLIQVIRPEATLDQCVALGVIVLEAVTIGMMFALESPQEARPRYLEALKTSVAALILGLSLP